MREIQYRVPLVKAAGSDRQQTMWNRQVTAGRRNGKGTLDATLTERSWNRVLVPLSHTERELSDDSMYTLRKDSR